MKSKRTVSLVLPLAAAVFAALSPAPAAAESMSAAADAAVAASRPLKAAGSLSAAARENLDAAKAERMPSVTLSANHFRFESGLGMNVNLFGFSASVPVTENHTTGYAVSAALPLYTGGRISKLIEAGEAAADSASYVEKTTENEVRYQASLHYVAVAEAEALLRAAEKHEAAVASHKKQTEARLKKGMAVKNELYAAESALATAHDAVIAAKTALSTAEASYNRLLGRELDESVTLDPIPEPLISETLPELTDDAVRSSTELASLSEQVKAADAAAGAARARNLPQAALVAGYGKQNGHYLTEERSSGWIAGVVVSWTIFDGGIGSSRAAASEKTAGALTDARAEAESVLRLDMRTAWLAWEETESRLNAAKSSLRFAEENLRVTSERYGAGLAPHTEVLDPCGPPQRRGSFTRPQNASGRGSASGSSPTRSERLLRPFKARIRLFSPTLGFFPGVFLSPSAEKGMAGLFFSLVSGIPGCQDEKNPCQDNQPCQGLIFFFRTAKKPENHQIFWPFPRFRAVFSWRGW